MSRLTVPAERAGFVDSLDRGRESSGVAGGVEALSVPEAARTRRSIRAYEPDSITEADLREILRLTGLAPSAFNVQPWRFVVVRDPEVKARLQEAANGQKQVGSAPAVIALYSDVKDSLDRIDGVVHRDLDPERREATAARIRGLFEAKTDEEREAWGVAQSYIALGYLLLLARSYGYDTSAMTGFDPEKVKALLGLPSHVRIPAIVAIGVAAEDGFRHHRFDPETIVRFV